MTAHKVRCKTINVYRNPSNGVEMQGAPFLPFHLSVLIFSNTSSDDLKIGTDIDLEGMYCKFALAVLNLPKLVTPLCSY